MTNGEQEYITEELDCYWKDIVFQFGGRTLNQIKAELDEMFWSDTDANGDLAKRIFDELAYQKSIKT